MGSGKTSLLELLKYAMGGYVDIRLAMLILFGSLFGIQLGAIGTTYVRPYMIKLVTAMIMLISASAFFLNFVLGIMGLPQALARFVAEIGVSPAMLMLILTVFYLILGCFLDSLAMIIGTIPIVFPLVTAVGIDPVWFGIFLVIMAELALITPPVGMNLYVVQGIRGHGSINDVVLGTLPFLVMMLLLVWLIWIWPELALWLPRLSFGSG